MFNVWFCIEVVLVILKWMLVLCLIVLMMEFWFVWMPVINIWTCLELASLIFNGMHCIKPDCFSDAFVKAMPSLDVHCWSNPWLREALSICVIYLPHLHLKNPKLLWALKLTLYNTISQNCYFTSFLLFLFVFCYIHHPISSILLTFLSLSSLSFFPCHCPLGGWNIYSTSVLMCALL